MEIEHGERIVADELRRREHQQRAVAEFGRLALTGADLRALFDAAVEFAAAALETELASILQLDAAAGALTCRAHVGWTDEMIRPVPVDAPSQIAHSFAATEPVVVDDLEHDDRFPGSRHLAALGIASAISVPIRGDDDPVGVLAAHSRRPRSFTDDDVYFMRAVANGLAAAVARETAEAARRATEERLRFLVEASEALARSLDYRAALREVAQLVVPRLADWCAVHVLEGERLELVAVSADDAARLRRARELAARSEAALVDDELSSMLSVPLTARGVVVGTLALVLARPGRRYGASDLDFAAELGRRAAVAIENARLHEREQEARARTERLQTVTAALAGALTAADVYAVLMHDGLAAAGAAACAVGTVSADGRWIELQAHAGYASARLERWRRFPLAADLPLADAVRTAQARFCETLEERNRAFPALVELSPEGTPHAFVTLPLVGHRGAIGAVAYSYVEERAFAPEERRLLEALAAQAGQALERALLHQQADVQRERARFLADASALLARGDDVDAALQQVAELAVERLASYCAVDRVIGGATVPVALADGGAARPGADEGVAAPIHGRRGVLGAVSLGTTTVDDDDVLLADELARRIAVAIENAEARRAAEEATDRIARLQAATASLARARTQAEVAQLVVTEGVGALGAVAGWLSLLDEEGRALELAAGARAYPESLLAEFRSIPIDASAPGADVVRDGRARWFESADALAAAYPALGDGYRASGLAAMAVVPVGSGGTPRGFVALNFGAEREFEVDERRLLEMLGEQCGQALERARLYDEREARANASFVLEHVADGVAQLDEHGTIGFWNAAAQRITGVPAADAVGRPVGDVLTGWTAGVEAGIRPPAAFPVEARGRELWLSVSAVTYGGGGVYAFRDLTEEHALEETRREFLATASHELRTPLAAVYGAAQTLRRDSIDAHDQAQLLAMIVRESERLARILDDMLLANRIDAGTIALTATSCDGGRIAREVLELAAQRAPARIELALDVARDLPAVHADDDTLRQVLVNLVDNAIKYSPGGGRVMLGVTARNGRVRFTVADEGLGIPPAEQEHVFEKFYRLDPELRRGIGGTGLGLYICRGLVERMGGTIAVSSAEGAGSTFVVELPRAG